jgi:hypothetical protein
LYRAYNIEEIIMKKSSLFLVFAIFSALLSGCILSARPGDVVMDAYETQQFSVIDLAQNPKQYIWELDGQVIPGAMGDSYEYTPDCGDEGVHTLKVTISWDSHTWNITVRPCPEEWSIDPQSLDFGYIQTEKQITIHNTGVVPISITAELPSPNARAADNFITGITSPVNPIAPGEAAEITVTVSRQGLAWGLYSASFRLTSEKGTSVTVAVTMNVGTAKVLFAVDTSGSMADNDPQDKRVSAVKEAINKFYDNVNVSFGIIDFDDKGKILTGFTRDHVLLEGYANSLGDDNGWTTYLAGGTYTPGALDLVDQLIDETELGTHFAVIFLSDGEPTKGTTAHDPIVAKVAALAAPGNLKLYTIYLNGAPQQSALLLLNDMAAAGGTGQTHLYTDPDSLSFLNLDF